MVKKAQSLIPLPDFSSPGPIGVFDSGYGGLTILREMHRRLPDLDFLYLGDNARAPYGTRSFEIVYNFTLQAVTKLFDLGCHLVILACNTASAKALRSIQQRNLPPNPPRHRVLGVIRPTVERVGELSRNGHVGVFATPGTIASESYNLEIAKLFPSFVTTGHGCPMWVPLVENGEADRPGADYFVRQEIDRLMQRDPLIDTVILGCTHYPLLLPKIRQYMPEGVQIVEQGQLVADSLADYLVRHPEIDSMVARGGSVDYLTTESPEKFNSLASLFMDSPVDAKRITL